MATENFEREAIDRLARIEVTLATHTAQDDVQFKALHATLQKLVEAAAESRGRRSSRGIVGGASSAAAIVALAEVVKAFL